MQKKKILIFSMASGFGHIKAGEALLNYANAHLPQIDAEHINIADFNPPFKEFNIKFYDVASKRLPFIWGLIYKMSDFKVTSFIIKKIAGFDYFFSRKMGKYIAKKNPYGIIFTNVVPLPLLNPSFRKKFSTVKMGVVATDYHGHPYYYFSWLDYYFVANEKVKNDLEEIGVDKEKIVITGIPMNPRFFIKENIKELKSKYGINNGLAVVLLIASFKISKHKLAETVGKLLAMEPKINLVFIANGNEAFYSAIKENFGRHERLLLVTWTDVIDEYMKMADVVISKAGGLTVSECMSLQKPLIMVNPIPGQEEHNAKFVEENNFGKKAKNVNDIFEILPKMIASAKHIEESVVPRQNSCEKIFEYFK